MLLTSCAFTGRATHKYQGQGWDPSMGLIRDLLLDFR